METYNFNGTLQCHDYTTQFRRRDPLMLLLTKEVFGTWAPNRVFAEISGHDIFRTYAEFSCVDGCNKGILRHI